MASTHTHSPTWPAAIPTPSVTIPSVTIPDAAWRDVSKTVGAEPMERLQTELLVNGVSFHLDAIRVCSGDCDWADGQHATAGSNEDDLDTVYGVGAQEPLVTVPIHGQPYVLFATPYSD